MQSNNSESATIQNLENARCDSGTASAFIIACFREVLKDGVNRLKQGVTAYVDEMKTK